MSQLCLPRNAIMDQVSDFTSGSACVSFTNRVLSVALLFSVCVQNKVN